MGKQVAVEEGFIESLTWQYSSAPYFPSDAQKFLKLTLEWQLLQLQSAAFDEKF